MSQANGEVRREATLRPFPEWEEKNQSWVAFFRGLTLVVQKKKHTGLFTQGNTNGEPFVATVSGIKVCTAKGTERSSRDLGTVQKWAVEVAKARPHLDTDLWNVVKDLRDGTLVLKTTPPTERLLTRSVMNRIADLIEQGKLGKNNTWKK